MNECKIQDSFAHASYFPKIFQATGKYVFQQVFYKPQPIKIQITFSFFNFISLNQ